MIVLFNLKMIFFATSILLNIHIKTPLNYLVLSQNPKQTHFATITFNMPWYITKNSLINKFMLIASDCINRGIFWVCPLL